MEQSKLRNNLIARANYAEKQHFAGSQYCLAPKISEPMRTIFEPWVTAIRQSPLMPIDTVSKPRRSGGNLVGYLVIDAAYGIEVGGDTLHVVGV